MLKQLKLFLFTLFVLLPIANAIIDDEMYAGDLLVDHVKTATYA